MSDTDGRHPVGGRGLRLEPRRSAREVWHDWRHDPVDRFGVVLFFVIATVGVSGLVQISSSWTSSMLVTAISGSALIATARAVGVRSSLRRIVLISVAVLLVGNALLALMEALDVVADPQVGTSGLVWLALVVVAPVLVIRRILAHRVVAMRTVLGAVTAYVQIAVAYAVLFRTVDAWSSAPFFGSPEPSTTYMYASLTTIATLGLGDVVPVGDVPRLVLASEAVLGQVFLVTVVAVVVSRFAEGRR